MPNDSPGAQFLKLSVAARQVIELIEQYRGLFTLRLDNELKKNVYMNFMALLDRRPEKATLENALKLFSEGINHFLAKSRVTREDYYRWLEEVPLESLTNTFPVNYSLFSAAIDHIRPYLRELNDLFQQAGGDRSSQRFFDPRNRAEPPVKPRAAPGPLPKRPLGRPSVGNSGFGRGMAKDIQAEAVSGSRPGSPARNQRP